MPPAHQTHENFDEADLSVCDGFANAHLREDAYSVTDSGTLGLWLARQLDYVKSRSYDRHFPNMNANALVPDATDAPEWAETITIRMFDSVGMAKVVANYADDLPRVDVRAVAKTITVKTIGDSFGYNVNELRASRATGVALDQKKADMARRAIELKISSIKLMGDALYGLFGLFNQPNIPAFVMPNTGDWTVLTGAQIYANMIAMVNAYNLQGNGIHTADHLELAPKAYAAANSQFVTGPTGIPITALALFQQANPQITVENIWELTGVGAGGKDYALLYERSADNFAHDYVMPFSQLPPEQRNLEIVTNCLARSAGVSVYYPLAFLGGITT
jgi:hypothetical protein